MQYKIWKGRAIFFIIASNIIKKARIEIQALDWLLKKRIKPLKFIDCC